MIPQETIQQILHAADISDVVGEFVSLKKRGSNLIACCPFHNEKTPSFSVSPSKQIYKCFGCGQGGDSVRFLMELEGLSYPDALRWLAKKYGIEIQEREYNDEDLLAQNERESLFIVHEYAQKYFEDQLKSGEGESIGLSYFKERGFHQATIEKFGLGYSPEAWNAFTEQALKSGFLLPVLEKAGLSIVKDDKDPIDRFRGRVIFPIHNTAGKTIAFGARILKTDAKAAKYLNSPETDIYHKSRIVYGIYHAKNSIRVQDNCFLVEGYTDVVSLHQSGIENVVASSGTSLTKEQVQLIRRFSNNITVLYDGDAAGINASLRGTDIILEEDMNVKVVVFPDKEDPDSYVRKVGGEAFLTYIKENQQDFIRFKTNLRLKEVGSDPIAKATLISELVQTITKIPDPIKRSVFFKEVADSLNIDEGILFTEGNKILRSKKTGDDSVKQGGQTFTPLPQPEALPEVHLGNKDTPQELKEEMLVRDLVSYGNFVLETDPETGTEVKLADYLLQEIKGFKIESPILAKIYEEYLMEYELNGVPKDNYFVSHKDEAIQKKVIDWLSPRFEMSENWQKFEIYTPSYTSKLDELSYKNLLRLKKSRFEKDIQNLSLELENLEDEGEIEAILNQILHFKRLVKTISNELGSII